MAYFFLLHFSSSFFNVQTTQNDALHKRTEIKILKPVDHQSLNCVRSYSLTTATIYILNHQIHSYIQTDSSQSVIRTNGQLFISFNLVIRFKSSTLDIIIMKR